jgi:hypothetical protein
MKWIFFSLAVVGAGVFLAHERSVAAVLQAELAQLQSERAELDAQRREHAHLLAQQPTAEELAQLQHAVAERAERQRAVELAARQRHEASALCLPVGEWVPQAQWLDRGQGSPGATTQTLLWAAFGGDVTRLESLLLFDAPVRAQLEKLFAGLPASARGAYAGPGQLMAAFTAKAIPMGDVQVVWQEQSGPDDAVACLWINHPAPDAVNEPAAKPVNGSKVPPTQPANPKRSQALLTLRRTDEGWRVLVPLHAVDRLAREVAGGK